MLVKIVMGMCKINSVSMRTKKHSDNDKILGVVIDNKFNLCHEFILNKQKLFGYIIDNKDNEITVQLIENYDRKKLEFDYYLKDYPNGKIIKIKKHEISHWYTSTYY